MSFRIRPAERSDIPAVVELIRELADFENLPGPDDQVVQRLEEHAFATVPKCEILVAEEGPEIAGYAVYFMTYSTFRGRPSLYLEDLYVRPVSRRRGIATAFLRDLAHRTVQRDAARFEWAVLDWNTDAQKFYVSLGAKILPEWRTCRIDGEALTNL
ncbi:MAG TPA: GNAT family N-acetyltransferase, partial [Polyangiaceae bacterium]